MEVSLLHPIVLNELNELIAGFRRIKAYEYLGRKKIPYTVVSLKDIREGEISENKERKNFTNSEIKAIYDYLKPKVEAEARKRQEATQLVGKDKEGNYIGASKIDEPKSRTDEKIASYVGVGKDTLRKIIAIEKEGTEKEKIEAQSKARQVSRTYNKIKKRQKLEQAHATGSPPMPEGLYDIIYADPAWRYDSEASQRGKADNHYATMSTNDIAELQVPSAENALLFLWVTNAHLEDGLRVLKAWGFEYVLNYSWVKDKIGLGWYARGQHELLFLARKGKMPHPEDHNRFSTVMIAPRGEHSAKPHVVYEMIEKMYPNRRYLELFSRNQREKWKMWGLEALEY